MGLLGLPAHVYGHRPSVYGKLADLFGRKRVFLLGIALFLVGSILCGLARSMGELIAFRALQGLGAGAVMPTIFTLLADLYPLHERGRVQVLFSGLWGGASLLGPSRGAWLPRSWSWRRVLVVSLPFGLGAARLRGRVFAERVERRAVSLELLGASLLTGSLTILLVAMTRGEATGWGGLEFVGLCALCAALLGAFVWAERRAAEPVLPLSLFMHPIIAVSSVGNFLSGAVLFGVTSYVPLWVQGVRGEDAAGAGAVLTPMLLAWAASGFFGPKLLLKLGFRATAIGATSLVALGAAGLAVLDPETPKPALYLAVTIMGFGFGPSTAAFVMAVQESVPWSLRGVATSTTQLFRSLGGTIGVALLGAILQFGLRSRLDASGEGSISAAALDPTAQALLTPEALVALQFALGDALRPVFFGTALLAAATFGIVALFARSAGPLGRLSASAPEPAADTAVMRSEAAGERSTV